MVPGCSGEDNTDFDKKDVCVTKEGVLHNIGNNINPGTGYYQRCEVSRINRHDMILHFLNYPFATIFTNY